MSSSFFSSLQTESIPFSFPLSEIESNGLLAVHPAPAQDGLWEPFLQPRPFPPHPRCLQSRHCPLLSSPRQACAPRWPALPRDRAILLSGRPAGSGPTPHACLAPLGCHLLHQAFCLPSPLASVWAAVWPPPEHWAHHFCSGRLVLGHRYIPVPGAHTGPHTVGGPKREGPSISSWSIAKRTIQA